MKDDSSQQQHYQHHVVFASKGSRIKVLVVILFSLVSGRLSAAKGSESTNYPNQSRTSDRVKLQSSDPTPHQSLKQAIVRAIQTDLCWAHHESETETTNHNTGMKWNQAIQSNTTVWHHRHYHHHCLVVVVVVVVVVSN